MIKKDFSVGMGKTNLVLIPIIVVVYVAMIALFKNLWGVKVDHNLGVFSFILIIIGGIIIHEAIHGFTWMKLGGISKDQIKYGFSWSSLTPYAHSKVPMKKSAYVIGAALPGIIMGVIPYIISLFIGNETLAFWGAFFTVVAAGDAMIIWLIRKVDSDALIEDHPTRAGCFVYEKDPNSSEVGAPNLAA